MLHPRVSLYVSVFEVNEGKVSIVTWLNLKYERLGIEIERGHDFIYNV